MLLFWIWGKNAIIDRKTFIMCIHHNIPIKQPITCRFRSLFYHKVNHFVSTNANHTFSNKSESISVKGYLRAILSNAHVDKLPNAIFFKPVAKWTSALSCRPSRGFDVKFSGGLLHFISYHYIKNKFLSVLF